MNSTITIHNNEPVAGTHLIAQGFERKHKYIIELIENNLEDFKDFGGLKRQKVKTKGRSINEYLLNEDQALFLGALFRNSKLVVHFKKSLVKEFSIVRRQLAALRVHQSSRRYRVAREVGKSVRKEATGVIQQFVIYADKQGSSNSQYYYSNITRMANRLLFIAKTKFKNLRDVMSVKQLMTISAADQIIEKALVDGMVLENPYKEIYKDVKSKVSLFAELHGQSEVVDRKLLGGVPVHTHVIEKV